MRFTSFILLLFSGLFFLGSCDMINPSEKIPTYLHIDSFRFVPTVNTGTQSHKITTVWVYLDNNPVGAYDLPATIPVLTDRVGTIMVLPGVLYSGLSDVIVPYPFYESDTMTLTPQPGQVVDFLPETKYYSDTTLEIINEDFESGNSFINLDGDTLEKTGDPNFVFEGSYGGVITLNNSDYAENLMSEGIYAPIQTFLELNYKGTLPFEIGVQTIDGTQTIAAPLFGFRPREDWNKVYVGLQDFISTYPNKEYRIFVRVSASAPTTGYVAFDNFKVITRK